MALITNEARDELTAVIIGMFDAAPGSAVLSVLVDATEAGSSLKDLAGILETKPQFEQVYPAHLTASEFADQLIDILIGNADVAAQPKASAHEWIVSQLDAGQSRSSLIVDAVQLLLNAPGAKWADAKEALLNKIEVSNYYSVTAQQSSNNLADLQAVINGVTSDDATVAAAIADIDAGVTSPTHSLTATKDVLNGGGGNDVFEALPIDSDGKAATTLNSFDVIDGGAGRDTLNINTTATENTAAGATIKNVEVVNIINGAAAAAALADASLYQGIEELWQVNDAVAAINLTNGVTAGFRNTGATALTATAAAAATTANVALAGVDAAAGLTVNGGKLDTLNLSGSLTAAGGSLATAVTLGAAVKTATINSEVDTTLTFTGAALATVDASGSTGDITYTSAPNTVAAIKSGAGDDTLKLSTATSATVSASVSAGAGDDDIEVNTSGVGTTTIKAGAGDDIVDVTARSDGKLSVDLGDGDDIFDAALNSIKAGDLIDGGAGVDTLYLNLVGLANVDAFTNFEVFDAIGLGDNLDMDILAQSNTVTEIIASGDVGTGAMLSNLGEDVGYRITGDDTPGAVGNALVLNQKTAGALAITLDIDESGTTAATTGLLDNVGAVYADNATAINATFDSDFVGAATGAGDNEAGLQIQAEAATELTIVSSGDNANNYLAFFDAKDTLTSVTVSGENVLTLGLTGSSNVATVDASGLSGGLLFDAGNLKAESAANALDGGLLTLGAGDDVIDIATGVQIAGLGLAGGAGETAQDGFDVLKGTNAQSGDNLADAYAHIEGGLVTFQSTGPTDLATAISQVQNAATGAAVFEYLGNSYIVDGADVVQLVGVTGLQGLDTVNGAAGDLYVF
ncbi:MAG TPA: hypothetical protein VNR18_13015 [Hyphomicrobiales bacterium]|nr:hypothetical protein [Hyphomicrobiales bacterium]